MPTRGNQRTFWAYNFIDNAFVRVEIESQTGVAIQVMISGRLRREKSDILFLD